MNFKKAFSKLERALLYLNSFFAALLLLSYLSAIVSPESFWPLAFLGLVYYNLLIINLLFVIYWVIRRRRYFYISAFSIIIGFNVLLNSVQVSSSPDPKLLSSVPHLKLMTYNVHNFEYIEPNQGTWAYRPMLNVINSIQPDVIGFEEYCVRSPGFKICDSLKATLHTDQFYFEPFKITQYDSTGLALYSKYPIVNRGLIRLSNGNNDNQAIYVDIKYKSRIIRIYDLHLQSLEFEEKDYAFLNNFFHWNAFSFDGIKRIVVKLQECFKKRGRQAELVRQLSAKCPYPYLFMGDFNDTPSSYSFSIMASGMKNAFREKGHGIGKTFNGGFASFQIDYILTNQQFNILDYQAAPKKLSDHYPVVSNVMLK